MIPTRWSPIGVDIAASFSSGIAALQPIFNSRTKAFKRRRSLHRLILAAPLFMICNCGMAQQPQSPSTPDAPSQSQESQTPKPANPIQSGVVLFKLLQEQSLVFPDLATNQGQLSSWQKFKLATNNSVALSTVGLASSSLSATSKAHSTATPSATRMNKTGRLRSANRFGASQT